MKRRQILASIATTSLLGAGVAAGRSVPSASVANANVDGIRVVRDGDVVETVANPSPDEIQRLLIESNEDEELYTSSDCCVKECLEDCYGCDCCMWGCSCDDGCDECC